MRSTEPTNPGSILRTRGAGLEDQIAPAAYREHQLGGLVRGAGMALAVGGLLFVAATVLHPSQETPTTILETEPRLVGSHAVYIVAYVLILFGLPAVYAMKPEDLGRSGLIGFLTTFTGTALLAISSQFGFIAPVLAQDAPRTLDQIPLYEPVVVFNGIAAVSFMAGFVMLGSALTTSRVFPRLSGILIAVGAPLHLVGFGIAQLVSPPLWFVAVLGSVALGSGLAWCGYSMWAEENSPPPSQDA